LDLKVAFEVDSYTSNPTMGTHTKGKKYNKCTVSCFKRSWKSAKSV